MTRTKVLDEESEHILEIDQSPRKYRQDEEEDGLHAKLRGVDVVEDYLEVLKNSFKMTISLTIVSTSPIVLYPWPDTKSVTRGRIPGPLFSPERRARKHKNSYEDHHKPKRQTSCFGIAT